MQERRSRVQIQKFVQGQGRLRNYQARHQGLAEKTEGEGKSAGQAVEEGVGFQRARFAVSFAGRCIQNGAMRPADLQLIGTELAIKWADGRESFIPLETLRRACPCAG